MTALLELRGVSKSFQGLRALDGIDLDIAAGDAAEYEALMAGLRLANPKMMDVAVPANMRQGLHQEEVARRGWTVDAKTLLGASDATLIDLRERAERDRHGCIPGALHAPYADLADNIGPGGVLHELASATGKRLVFFCAFGERSAMAVQAAQDAGLNTACHIEGGMGAWKAAGGALAHGASGSR